MSYRLVYTQRALKDIQKLEPRVKARIGKALLRFEQDPLRHAKPLTNADLGTYRFRVGEFRIIFDIEGKDIVILRVGHRRQIYRG
ncbi:type II toxin-antitoxin system RelE family toxin [Geoalkalibacter halelectricus]|uniref:Type II toxin-antitoxin system RelE/ParE family toxin n=1 Tax=Geoalkalibacter halelectricus TaxID=2847045 RepID=A0ABY5ZMJ8_9BACT|nr:type II toxin-antitoxin system RelE/ParE family toxin [Geoalkalibacter halelectricus]MDO3377846.1 type II toxin-antitoxin system RelE/ParE family toxin [Geoalkalibacter halelectricus]UWZ79709.1 type II toxin-antitoxin system RelE/ParE family toxin [Geoalkalibacter halelectricus]